MRKSLATILIVNLCALLWAGCGGKPQPDKPVAVKPTAPAPAAPTAPAATPSEAAPPPPPTAIPVTATVATQKPSEMVDAQGKQLDSLQFLQLMVGQYDRLRPGSASDDQHPGWPPLTDLSQLVKVGLVKSLPEAPAGQKFVVDPKTMKVSLVTQ